MIFAAHGLFRQSHRLPIRSILVRRLTVRTPMIKSPMVKTRPTPAKKIAKKAASKAARKKAASPSGRTPKAGGRLAVEAWLNRVKPELQPLARRLDQLILEAMPDAVCSLKWNVPFYGLPGQGWIAAINSFKAHVKFLFFAGSALKPMPPAGKRHNAIDFYSEEDLDETQVKSWLQQAKTLPGWNLKTFPGKVA